MGRNKGRQCGGHSSKRERYILQRRMHLQVSTVLQRRSKERHAQSKLNALQQASLAAVQRKVRLDVVRALMHARLQDDHVEHIQLKRNESIADELQKSVQIEPCASLQERCLFVIAQTFDLYTSSCPYTQEFFAFFEPWMITRLSELTTAFKTVNDSNVSLLLRRPTPHLTLGFVRQERSLALLAEQDGDRQALAWQSSRNDLFSGGFQEVDSWDELDIDDVDIVQTQETLHLSSLRLVSCRGLSVSFLAKLTEAHPHLQDLDLTDCFEVENSEDATELLRCITHWRALKTLRISWCSWLTTESLVAFAHQLLEPPATTLEAIYISHVFDVVEEYVRAIFTDLHPTIQLSI